jgi:hypothetical protein
LAIAPGPASPVTSRSEKTRWYVPPVGPVDDGVGRAFPLVVDAALDQSAEDRLCGLVAMKRLAGDIGFVTPVSYRLDDVASDTEVAEGRLEPGLQGPLRRADLLGQTEALELGGAAEHQPA